MKRYACNNLYLPGQPPIRPAFIGIDEKSHHVMTWGKLDGGELPFTEWLGGNIIVSMLNRPEQSLQFRTLDECLACLHEKSCSPETAMYAWHTSYINNQITHFQALLL